MIGVGRRRRRVYAGKNAGKMIDAWENWRRKWEIGFGRNDEVFIRKKELKEG